MAPLSICVLRLVSLLVVVPSIFGGNGAPGLRPTGFALATRVRPAFSCRTIVDWLSSQTQQHKRPRISDDRKQILELQHASRLVLNARKRPYSDLAKAIEPKNASTFLGEKVIDVAALELACREDLYNTSRVIADRVISLIAAGASTEARRVRRDVLGETAVVAEIVITVDDELRSWIASRGGWLEEAIDTLKQTTTDVPFTVTDSARTKIGALVAKFSMQERAMVYLDTMREVFTWVLYQEDERDRQECLRLLFRYYVWCRGAGASDLADCYYPCTVEELKEFGAMELEYDELLLKKLIPGGLRMRSRFASGRSLYSKASSDTLLGVARDAMVIKRAQEHFARAAASAVNRLQLSWGASDGVDPIAFYRARLPRSRSENVKDAAAFVFALSSFDVGRAES